LTELRENRSTLIDLNHASESAGQGEHNASISRIDSGNYTTLEDVLAGGSRIADLH